MRFLLRAGDADYVYFVEFRGRGIFLRAAPIDVSAIVRELLLDRMRTTVLTSATLTVDGTFEYIRERLGIRGADEIRLPSEFDFAQQAILYLPPRMPDPRSQRVPAGGRPRGGRDPEAHARARVRPVHQLRDAARCAGIAEMALDYPIFVQGTAPRTQLLKQFRETPHAVLFATSSFWQGVDVVGEALSCVIIDKLPFASPGDPITAARIDAIRARGGEPSASIRCRWRFWRCSRGWAGSSATGRTAACWRCSIPGCEPRDTGGGSSLRCRPRRRCHDFARDRGVFFPSAESVKKGKL